MTIGYETAVYSIPARILHWLIAAIVIAMIPLGFIMTNAAPGPAQDAMFNLHVSLGATLILLIVLRIIWRLTHTPPPLPAGMPAIQRWAASTVHFLLYVTLIVQPLLGWIGNSAYPAPVTVFGIVTLPPIWSEDRALSDQIFLVHRNIGILIAALICVHVAGALFHQFIQRDNLIRRMLW